MWIWSLLTVTLPSARASGTAGAAYFANQLHGWRPQYTNLTERLWLLHSAAILMKEKGTRPSEDSFEEGVITTCSNWVRRKNIFTGRKSR